VTTPAGVSSGPQWSHWAERIRGERPRDDRSRLEVWGYAGRPSYAPGESLALHVSTTARTFDVLVYRDGGEREVVYEARGLAGAWHPTPDDAYAAGCGWPVAHTVEVPAAWRPGAYVIEFTASDERGTAVQDGFFVVRPEAPGRDARIAVVLATYTWQSYNDWGGGCAYSLDVPAGDVEGFSPRLAFERPWARGLIRQPSGAPRIAIGDALPIGWAPRREQGEWALANGYSCWSGSAGWAQFDGHFVRWAERAGYAIELLTQWDLDRDPSCLRDYACVVTVGHDEYWTARGRRALDDFVETGGRYARFAGNIMWQVRVVDELRTQVSYKMAPEADPLAASADRARRTGAFESAEIGDPPVTTFGANGARGVYSRVGGASPRGVGGFVVYRNDHWAFAGTDLYYADVLGRDVPLVGYESDGLAYTFDNGLPIATGEDGAPPELEILALTPVTRVEEDHGTPGAFLMMGSEEVGGAARTLFGEDTPATRQAISRGAAVMTWMPKGDGEVLCGGSTEWPWALACGERIAERVVANVLDRYSA
jgi:hypothetical protein